MRIVFMGTPAFAVPSLEALAAEHNVVAVYTQPDRAKGRGRQVSPSPVKLSATKLGLGIEQPPSLRDTHVQTRLAAHAPDVICVAAYGLMLPPEVLDLPPLGCLNVHASLLPRHRGAAPIHRAVLEGDELVGVSIMRMEEGLDTGPYASVRSVAAGERTVGELTETLARLGAEALVESVVALESGTIEWTEQDDSQATYASKISASDVSLAPELSVSEALRHIRASTPSAKSKAVVADRNIQVITAVASERNVGTGLAEVIDDHVFLGLSDGAIRLLQVKPSGKSAMTAEDFARGTPISPGTSWSGQL